MNEDKKKAKIIVNAGYQLVKDEKISNSILETIIQPFATEEELKRRSNEEYMKVKSRQAPNRNT